MGKDNKIEKSLDNEEQNDVQENGHSIEETNNEKKKSKKGNSVFKYLIVVIVILAFIGGAIIVNNKLKSKDKEPKKEETTKKVMKSKYAIKGNGLDDFDLYHIKNNNNKTNKVYSPLSIKTALAMLSDGANGDSKDQIVSVIGDYKPKKYKNSSNMSFANSMFINNNFKDNVKSEYIEKLKNKYDADVQYDSFATPDIVNKWVDSKTFGQIKNLTDDISENSFIQVNALAIDMEWVDVFQKKTLKEAYSVGFPHENFFAHVTSLDNDSNGIMFNDQYQAASGEFAGVINRYDIVNELGEANIRKEVGDAYTKWLAEDPCGTAATEPDVSTYLDQYIKDINTGYKHVSSSTDYKLYYDDNVKAFAKDLKTYDGVTLQYFAVMPKKDNLEAFISNTDAKSLNTIINNLKDVKLENFNDKVITKIVGNMPFFNFKYEIKLIDELKKLGITDVFDINKADLSNMIKVNGTFIDKLIHKANIEVTNEGIKAAAATMVGGYGSASCGFSYSYDVPIEEINMDFDKPFLYLVRDKDTGEVWFAGTVYEPKKFELNESRG